MLAAITANPPAFELDGNGSEVLCRLGFVASLSTVKSGQLSFCEKEIYPFTPGSRCAPAQGLRLKYGPRSDIGCHG